MWLLETIDAQLDPGIEFLGETDRIQDPGESEVVSVRIYIYTGGRRVEVGTELRPDRNVFARVGWTPTVVTVPSFDTCTLQASSRPSGYLH